MSKRIDLTGQKFGKWTVLRCIGWGAGGGAIWLCRCDCEARTERPVSSQKLRERKTFSCGCYRAEATRKQKTKHGHTPKKGKSRTYRIWRHMMRRCHSPNEHNYKWYGALGIIVCRHWRKFENFLADMGECPEGKEIGRRNHAKNYEPGNCDWITKHENVIERLRGYRPPK